MKFTPALQRALQTLPLAGANLLVDAVIEDAGAAAEFNALLRTLVGSEGTIVMPAFTHCETLSDEVIDAVAFHSDLAVSAYLGAVAEDFRRHPHSLRSAHPTHSFAAWGGRAYDVLSTNRDNNPLGPVKKLNLLVNAMALRVDLPLSRSTAIHLAELQSLAKLRYRGTAKRINMAGYEERVVVEHVATCTEGFDRIAAAVAAAMASEWLPEHEGLDVMPLRELIRAVGAVVAGSPELILCERAECRSCAARRTAIERRRAGGA